MPQQPITTKEAHAVLSQVGPAMRGLTKKAQALEAENADLRTKVAHYELKERATKLAQQLDRRGLIETDLDTKVAELMQEPDKLPVREEAIKMASPQQLLGELSEERTSGGKSQLESFVLDEE